MGWLFIYTSKLVILNQLLSWLWFMKCRTAVVVYEDYAHTVASRVEISRLAIRSSSVHTLRGVFISGSDD